MTEVSTCALDDEGLARHHERYVRLAPAVVAMRRDGPQLTVQFAPDYDERTLAELIAVERQCCPFFGFWFDEDARRLAVGVTAAEHAPALDSIAELLRRRPAHSPR